ncbi:U-box domain-containing protein 52-like [Telopea speciosissima]|uniref:U-box domain-containing protein 52-like n=1 Tax=Telopea speciosissima TaxID=54955 RepID=UPI001CC78E78|nr:U-box domain-containing protein 52-like [Telopea speciosissima]
MAEEQSREGLYIVLLERFRDLEVSHTNLNDQFQVLLQETREEQGRRKRGERSSSSSSSDSTGWSRFLPGSFLSRTPYRNVLESMGHAVYVCRISTGEIIYWNRSAEKLYGWKDYEVLGRRVTDLAIRGENYASLQKIMEGLSSGQSWSGQFPFKKRSGEIFMAIVTESPLYEDGEHVGVITVSSDAALYHNINTEKLTYRDRAHGQIRERGLNMKKIQWRPQPHNSLVPQIASSVTNLASKVFSRGRGEDNCTACASDGNREEPGLSTEAVESVKIGKPVRFDFSTCTSLFLGDKLFVRRAGLTEREDSGNVAEHGSDNISVGSVLPIASNSMKVPETAMDHYTVGVDRKNVEPNKSNSVYAVKSVCSNDHKINSSFEGSSTTDKNTSVTSWLECCKYTGMSRTGIPLPQLGPEWKGKEQIQADRVNCEAVEAEGRTQQEPEVIQSSTLLSSGESVVSSQESSSTKEDKESSSMVDCEISWEDLHLGDEIGQGSFATVYRGIWNGSDVAIKLYFASEYHEGILLDYKKEIGIMQRLRHPNVLLFMGAVYSAERLAIVTEFLPRGSLFKTLHRNNLILDMRRRLRMALDVARGMNYLHNRNPPIVHRDLKSSNLLVDKNWTVKVGDFGLSKLKNATFLTAKSGRGTPQWMAPEVLRNEPSNEKSDVYSFGVILWELMTESIPWAHLNSLQVVGVVGFMDRRLDVPEGLDPKVSSIVHDCWQSNPECRPSFKDIILRIRDLIQAAAAAVAAPVLEDRPEI